MPKYEFRPEDMEWWSLTPAQRLCESVKLWGTYLAPDNLARLRRALEELMAEGVFVPPLEESYLRRGHGCHFRCRAPEVAGLRIDIMSVLRGCDTFEKLWERREVVSSRELGRIDLLSLPDLVAAKKT